MLLLFVNGSGREILFGVGKVEGSDFNSTLELFVSVCRDGSFYRLSNR